MGLPRNIRHNLGFLLTELPQRLTELNNFVHAASPATANGIIQRSGYLTNLKQRIHDACYSYITEADSSNSKEILRVRAIDIIATELEHISELCVEFVQQAGYIDGFSETDVSKLSVQLDLVMEAVEMIRPALFENNTEKAVKIGRMQDKLARRFRKLLKKNAASLRDTTGAEDLLAIAFSAYAIERMGDSLQRISEAVISSNLGLVMDAGRFQSMQESIGNMTDSGPAKMKVATVAETRSGAGISSVRVPGGDRGDYNAIFKEGHKKKLKQERKGVENWHDVFPGIAPQILSWNKRGDSASLLFEHLSGQTFERILLHGSTSLLRDALAALGRTLCTVWTETRADKPVAAAFMQQLGKRVGDVYAVHPEFSHRGQRVGSCFLPAFDDLCEQASALEADFAAPFSVYIHGDFNIDNIIYDSQNDQLRYVDLHRSRYMDYVQDVSVFMVSNYRLQVIDSDIRRRISAVIGAFYDIAVEFAHDNRDSGFEVRLALGLVRSLATSTRFILDRKLARNMFLRSRYLLDQLVNLKPDTIESYRVPVEVIFNG